MNATTVELNSTKSKWEGESPIPPALQFVLGVLGNGIALSVIMLSKEKHKWRPFYKLVAALALTDGGGILAVYPSVMSRYATNFTFDFPKSLCDYSSFVYSFTLLSSAMIICAMSLDRFLAIVYPFVYNCDSKSTRINIMLATIWLSSAAVCSLHVIGYGSSFNFYPGSWCFINFKDLTTANMVNTYIYAILGLIILGVTITVNIIVILHLCRNMSRRRRTRRDMHNIIFLMVLLSVISLLWTPLIIVMLGHMSKHFSDQGERELTVLRLAVSNSIVDPWIYILLRKETLQAYCGLWGKLCTCLGCKSGTKKSLQRTRATLENVMENSADIHNGAEPSRHTIDNSSKDTMSLPQLRKTYIKSTLGFYNTVDEGKMRYHTI